MHITAQHTAENWYIRTSVVGGGGVAVERNGWECRQKSMSVLYIYIHTNIQSWSFGTILTMDNIIEVQFFFFLRV